MKSWYTKEEKEKEAAKSALQEENEVRKAAMILKGISHLKENDKRETGKEWKEAKGRANIQAEFLRLRRHRRL